MVNAKESQCACQFQGESDRKPREKSDKTLKKTADEISNANNAFHLRDSCGPISGLSFEIEKIGLALQAPLSKLSNHRLDVSGTLNPAFK